MQSSVIVLLVLAIIAANLPFILPRVGGFMAVKHKHFGWQLLELVVLYLLIGLLARFLEGRQMPVHAQNWQFYVTTIALFAVFAFPGFAGCYFWKKRRVTSRKV
ncbi:DUF2818 family protein [Craterilacuibacter sp.]|uniref:DUF2818 family protein n=1 Tax=Craterilacuibacter sp. TaxID=2870909 RepID=UPI003F2C4BE8